MLEPPTRVGAMAYALLPNAAHGSPAAFCGGKILDGQLHKDHIRSELGGFFSQGHAEGSVTTGTFAYDEGTLRGLVTDWLDLAKSYDDSQRVARDMATVTGPGKDFASQTQADAASAHGAAYIAYLHSNYTYCANQAQLFQNALDDYLGIEHHNVTEINKSGQHGPQPGI